MTSVKHLNRSSALAERNREQHDKHSSFFPRAESHTVNRGRENQEYERQIPG
jgi:hypothetical protein